MRIFLLLAALITFAGCDVPLGGQAYLPADAGIDPYQSSRAQAERYFQAGLAAEKEGDLKQALDDLRQARQWDHDGRQDIQTALSRLEANVRRESRVPPTPTSTAPDIALREFRSRVFPYSISLPVGWTTKQEGTDDQPVDAFIHPASTTLKAVMLITVEPVKSGVTLDELYLGSKQALESEGASEVQIVDRRLVGDQPAYVMSYRTDAGSSQASVLHAILVTPARAWHIILIATPATTSELVNTFDEMLDSVRLQSSAFPVL